MFNECLINWKATLQHMVVLSTTDAEYTVPTEVVKETLWLQGLRGESSVNKRL